MDKNAEEAALRETEEELGIQRHSFDIWAQLPSLQGRDGKTAITPVIALLKVLTNQIRLLWNSYAAEFKKFYFDLIPLSYVRCKYFFVCLITHSSNPVIKFLFFINIFTCYFM